MTLTKLVKNNIIPGVAGLAALAFNVYVAPHPVVGGILDSLGIDAMWVQVSTTMLLVTLMAHIDPRWETKEWFIHDKEEKQ